MENRGVVFGGLAVAIVTLVCPMYSFAAEKTVNASSFGWNAEDSTAAVEK